MQPIEVTIDAAGRIVVPKAMREELGFTPGVKLQLSMVDGNLLVEPVPAKMRLVKKGNGLVAVIDGPQPTPMSQEEIRDLLERIRERR